MPRQVDLGTTEIVVKTLEIGGTKVENLSLQEVTQEGNSTTIPITLTELNLPETDQNVLFSDSGTVRGTPNITHNKLSKLTNILGKINLTKPSGSTKVGYVTQNETKSVGVVLDDSDILTISYVNPTTLEVSEGDVSVEVRGTMNVSSDFTVGGNVLKVFKNSQQVKVGNTLVVDDSNVSTHLSGNTTTERLTVEQINFNESELYVSPSTVSANYSGGTLTLDCNHASFGRCLAIGTIGNGETLGTYVFQNLKSSSRIHILLPQATGNFTISNTPIGGIFQKVSNQSMVNGDHALLEIENINGHNLISVKIFS
jgi:hypothetical protein